MAAYKRLAVAEKELRHEVKPDLEQAMEPIPGSINSTHDVQSREAGIV